MHSTAPSERPRVLNSSGRRKNDEQARKEAGRAGRATATAAMAPEAGWPAWHPVARQAGQSARAQADHLADAARTGPLGSDSSTGTAPHPVMGRRFLLVDLPGGEG